MNLVTSGGIKAGEMVIYSGGRGRGKSIYNNFFQVVPMKPEPQYKFSRKWHVAEYDWRDFDNVWKWCEEQFGPHPQNPDAWSRWHQRSMGRIHFRDDRDYVMFLLRWA